MYCMIVEFIENDNDINFSIDEFDDIVVLLLAYDDLKKVSNYKDLTVSFWKRL